VVNVGILHDHLEYFVAIWYNLWPFGIHSLWSFVIFFQIWYVWTKKSLATLLETRLSSFTHYQERFFCLLLDGKKGFCSILCLKLENR
jgi:hypothetical protein